MTGRSVLFRAWPTTDHGGSARPTGHHQSFGSQTALQTSSTCVASRSPTLVTRSETPRDAQDESSPCLPRPPRPQAREHSRRPPSHGARSSPPQAHPSRCTNCCAPRTTRPTRTSPPRLSSTLQSPASPRRRRRHLGRRPVATTTLIAATAGSIILTQVHTLLLLAAYRALRGLAVGRASGTPGDDDLDTTPTGRAWLASGVNGGAITSVIAMVSR